MDMSSVATLSPRELDVRARIVETAEALFRDIGYQKTAVAERVTAAVRARMTAIARADRPAGERLRDLLRTMNACMCELGVSEAKMHDMVEAAMNENWGVIRAHIDGVDQIITGVVADGVASGEFDADPKIAGPCIRAAMIRFCHPAIIAQCHDMPLPTLDQQIEFVLAAVRTR